MKTVLVAMLSSVVMSVVPSYAGDIAPGTLMVGRTGITCIQAPCPWRGVVAGEAGSWPIWWGEEPPEMIADADDRDRIINAWDASECVVVEGSMTGETLTVAAVTGSC